MDWAQSIDLLKNAVITTAFFDQALHNRREPQFMAYRGKL
jgi:hypothetical protein